MIPAYEEAKKDPALRDLSIVVYLHLVDQLDVDGFKPVKQVALASLLRVTERSIRDALAKLVDLGYVKRRRRRGRSHRYQLVRDKLP